MSSVPTRDDQLLQAQISQAHEALGALERDLREIDLELGSLSEQRERYDLLDQACGSLERLYEIGGTELFWGEAAQLQAVERVREARSRLDVFQQRLGEIESRRDAVLGQIKERQEVLDILEDDLFEFRLVEEERQQEWVPERDIIVVPARPAIMPWSRGEDDWRFRKSLSTSLLVALLLGVVVPAIDLPLTPLDELAEVPERLARLIQQRELPPPPPPVMIEEPEPLEPEPEPEPVADVEPEPIVVEELPTEVPEVEQTPAPTVAEEAAPPPEEPPRPAGILAFRESFSSLADNRPVAQLGAEARINSAGEAAVGRTERSMVTTQGPGSSGGINLASLSRDVGGGGGQGIEGVQVTRVASSIGPAGGGDSDRPLSGGATAGRTDEEIQIVFDRYKAALYRLYNRELRNDPTLRGQVVLQLTIEPDGSVSFCEVQASDMNAPVLEQQVVERVLTFDFGAKDDISAITILYPIDFLPAA